LYAVRPIPSMLAIVTVPPGVQVMVVVGFA
jgi:hypothetical protein